MSINLVIASVTVGLLLLPLLCVSAFELVYPANSPRRAKIDS